MAIHCQPANRLVGAGLSLVRLSENPGPPQYLEYPGSISAGKLRLASMGRSISGHNVANAPSACRRMLLPPSGYQLMLRGMGEADMFRVFRLTWAISMILNTACTNFKLTGHYDQFRTMTDPGGG